MKIQFKIHYTTQWGQTMYLILHTSGNSIEKYGMHCNDKSEWKAELKIDQVKDLSYQYAVQNADKSLAYEYGGVRTIQFDTVNENITVVDNWRASYGDSPFVSTAFTDCFFKRKSLVNEVTSPVKNLILRQEMLLHLQMVSF